MSTPMTALDLHKYAAQMRVRADKLAGIAADGAFAKGDARDAFHNNALNAILNHCITLGMFHAARVYPLTRRNRDASVIEIMRLFSIDGLQEFYFGKQREHLLLQIWFACEDWLRVLYRGAIPKHVQVADERSERLKFASPPKHASLPITTVRDRVLDAAADRGKRGYRKQLKHCRKVIDFWSSTRNAICHSNTFYDGPPRDLKLGNRTLKLVRGKPTDLSLSLFFHC